MLKIETLQKFAEERKSIVILLTFPFQLITIIFFISIFPILLVYSWLRFIFKKNLHQKPKILFSPMALPMNFLIARAVKTQNYPVDVFAYDEEPIFEDMNFGFTTRNSVFLRVLLCFTTYIPIFVWAVFRYDIFESPFTGGVLSPSRLRKIEYLLLKILAKKIVVFGYGSDSQIPSEIKKMSRYNAYMDFPDEPDIDQEDYIRENIARAKKYSDVMFAGLLKLDKKMLMMPIPIDLSKWKYHSTKKTKIITLMHSTNHQIYKGTRFIIKAVEELQKEGLPIKLNLIEGKTLKECYKLYPDNDIFIPHVIGGWYVSTPCEGMALGKPVICNLDKKIAKPYQYFAKECPIVNVNPDNLKRAIRKLTLDFELRKKLGQLGVEYVHKYHSFRFAGIIRTIAYEKIWAGEKINQKILEKELRKRKLL